MTKDKARQWDGKSRPSNNVYSKRWNEIFGKKKTGFSDIKREDEEKDNQEYLDSINKKL
jgi:hypothetical protein|tara:strand:+ start:322 stop:498 length:177 start_codon:yes stop_codon:yes gene_type:complete